MRSVLFSGPQELIGYAKILHTAFGCGLTSKLTGPLWRDGIWARLYSPNDGTPQWVRLNVGLGHARRIVCMIAQLDLKQSKGEQKINCTLKCQHCESYRCVCPNISEETRADIELAFGGA